VTDEGLRAAVAASALAGQGAEEELLRSIVEVACAIFEAGAASISTYDPETDELVFRAVTGAGSATLIGTRFPSTQGIAGWVLASGEPIVVDDVTRDPRWAEDVAIRTGYMPRALMAAPLLADDSALGVLSVLDRPADQPFGVAQMDLLSMFARQASIALDVISRARGAGAALEGHSEADVVARVAGAIARMPPARRAAGIELLESLEKLLSDSASTTSGP
jgi:GAF domain-containing protein